MLPLIQLKGHIPLILDILHDFTCIFTPLCESINAILRHQPGPKIDGLNKKWFSSEPPPIIRFSWFDSFSQFGSIWIRLGIFDLFQGKLSFARLGYLDLGWSGSTPTPQIIYGVGRGRFRFLGPKIDGLNNKWFSSEPPPK